MESQSASPPLPEEATPSQPSTSSNQPLEPAAEKCAHCQTSAPTPSLEDAEQDRENGLKPCSKCHTALYCSRACAKAAWKTHKKTCAVEAQKYALSTKEKPVAVPRAPKKEGHRGGLQKWQFDT